MWKLGKSQFRMKSNPSLKKERKKKRKAHALSYPKFQFQIFILYRIKALTSFS